MLTAVVIAITQSKGVHGWANKPREMKEIKRTQRPHACSQCDAAFGQASDLRTHVRTVHKQREEEEEEVELLLLMRTTTS